MKLIACILTMLVGIQTSLVAQESAVIDEVIAVIGSEILLKSDYEKNVVQYKSQGALIDDDMRCQILEDLLFQKLLVNQSKLDSIEVTDDQIEAELERRIQYFVSQIGSERALEEYYKKSMDEIREELREVLEEQMIIQRMQQEVTMGMDVTPSEVKDYFSNIPEDSLPLVNAQVEVAQLVKYAPPNRQQVEEAREKLNSLRDRIVKNGEDFATMAILYSEDPGTAKQGGELGFVGRAEVDPAFAEAAFKLKGNETSRIVTSDFGLHIIQLIEKKGDKVNVRHILIKPKIEGSAILKSREVVDSLRNAIVSYDTLDFNSAAERHSDDKDSKNNGGLMVNPYDNSSFFEFDQLDPSVYIAIEKLKVGEISQPSAYSTRDGKKGYAIYKVLKKKEAHRANMKLDYQIIQAAALAQKEEDVIREWIESKLAKTYSDLNDNYKSCEFRNDWDKLN